MIGCVRNILRYRVPVTGVLTAGQHQAAAAAGPAVKWDIVAAVCVERPPYLTPGLSDIEKKTMDLLKQKEYEQSMLNDHELRHKYVTV